MGYGVWALIVQNLISYLIAIILFNYFCRWKIKIIFSKTSFHHLWGFGSKMLISSLLNTIYNNLYQIVIGKFYSAADLGQYLGTKLFRTLFKYFNASGTTC